MTENTPIAPGLPPSIEHLRNEWNTRSEDVQWGTAITLAEMSKLAYTDPHNRKFVLQQMGFDEVVILKKKSMSGFLAMTNDVAIVAFRGTDMLSWDDWCANKDFRDPLPLNSGHKIHQGFYQDAYMLLADEIKESLGNKQLKHVWITGHSLGGAMATCCAYDRSINHLPFTGLVTFGQPRIGNDALARFLDNEIGGRYMRFVNETDMVPILPPGIGLLFPDYWHCGDRIRFKEGKLDRWSGVTICSASGPSENDSPDTIIKDTGKDGEETITEEAFLEYQKQLRKNLDRRTAPGFSSSQPEAESSYGFQPSTKSMPDSKGLAEYLFQSIGTRIKDHSMDEYLRQLNEFRLEIG